jgi:hypothetical protein
LQTHRSDRMARLIYETSDVPVLIVSTHRHHGHTGRMMGLAWEFHQRYARKLGWVQLPHFVLAHKSEDPSQPADPTSTLKRAISEFSPPLDVWAVNFRADIDIDELNCQRHKLDVPINDYQYRLYQCRG